MILYRVLIQIISLFEIFIGLFSKKYIQRLSGLKNWRNKLIDIKISSGNRDIIWFHVASLGEFEQARPLIDYYFNQGYFILVSFFSPSGLEFRKNYERLNAAIYLPLDTYTNSRKFINILKPKFAIFVKYEFWWNYLNQLTLSKTPTFFVASIFRKNQYFLRPCIRNIFLPILQKIDCFFVQNENSLIIANLFHLKAELTGDSRVDNVIQRSENRKEITLLDEFDPRNRIIVYGSIWVDDLKILESFINNSDEFLHIVVPHDINDNYITKIKKLIPKSIMWDEFNHKANDSNIVIVNKMGMLFDLYYYSTMSYVGGGFHNGLHNILEPISFGKPVIFGPKHKKFPEAKLALDSGIGFEICETKDIYDISTYIIHNLSTINRNADVWLLENVGSKDKIVHLISKKIKV